MRRRTLLLGSLGLTALSLPALAKTPELTADVVIVGSGGAGLMAAYANRNKLISCLQLYRSS